MLKLNQQNQDLIDDAFYVIETRWKTWKSYDKDNKELVTSLSKEICISHTRFYLKGLQEGFDHEANSYEGTVGGKL